MKNTTTNHNSSLSAELMSSKTSNIKSCKGSGITFLRRWTEQTCRAAVLPSVWSTSGIRLASPSLLQAKWFSSEGSSQPEGHTETHGEHSGCDVVARRSHCDRLTKWQHQYCIYAFIFKEAGGLDARSLHHVSLSSSALTGVVPVTELNIHLI